ncbi:hypothetical protein N0V94_007307 [Neodidymelliopsis sp. IMI 364377]|nr:hypothetical protein N0V94_007307 [Neodidymelliopsis sp. IMI 364377]
MYPHSRQANQYPVPAPPPPQQQRADAPPLPPPPQLHDPGHLLQLPPPTQQQQQQQQQQPPPQQQLQSRAMYQQQDMPPVVSQNGDYSGTQNGYIYRLSVEQQPIRARMCGFGDKDRRPITPPPCVRLIVCDAATGQEIDASEIDTTFCILLADLWPEDTSRGACNLVRHSSAAPTVSISSSVTTSFPPQPDRQMFLTQGIPTQFNQYGQPIAPPNPYAPQQYYANQPSPGYPPYPAQYAQVQTSNSSQHTRNLIGQSAVNAYKLNDPDGKPGFWFVFQDLSVRTEGTFRLKFMMTNIGSGEDPSTIMAHDEKRPMLGSCFSDPFTVYSAKKFPGVIESTALSKCFAQQGIKIPIRKDGPRTLSNQSEFDADD